MSKKKKKFKKLFKKILFYSTYCDCFSRILYEFIQNGDENLSSTDIPNLSELFTKYTNNLYKNILNLHKEFMIEFKDFI